MKEYKLVELTSSRIQYDKNPPRFIKWIILIIVILLAGIIVLASFTYKTEVVRSTSIISSSNKINVQSPNKGQIKKIYVLNGDYVNEGDLLFEMDTTQIDSSILSLDAKCLYIQEYIDNYNLMINILNNVNIDTLAGLYNPFESGQFVYEFKNVIKEINDVVAGENETIADARKNIIEQYISSYYNTLFQYEYELLGNQSQIEGYEEMKKTYFIYATTDGYVNFNSNVSENNVIDSSVVMTISEELTMDNSIVDTYITAEHRSFLDINNEVEITVAGLSQAKYGLLTGKVVDISDDVIIDKDGNALYKVSIKPDSIELKKNNKVIKLVNGQICEIRIKYESVSWMTWALTKMGILK